MIEALKCYIDEWYTEPYECPICGCQMMVYVRSERCEESDSADKVAKPSYCANCGIKYDK